MDIHQILIFCVTNTSNSIISLTLHVINFRLMLLQLDTMPELVLVLTLNILSQIQVNIIFLTLFLNVCFNHIIKSY